MIPPKGDHSEPANGPCSVRKKRFCEIHALTIPIEQAEIGRGQTTLERLLCALREAGRLRGRLQSDSRATPEAPLGPDTAWLIKRNAGSMTPRSFTT